MIIKPLIVAFIGFTTFGYTNLLNQAWAIEPEPTSVEQEALGLAPDETILETPPPVEQAQEIPDTKFENPPVTTPEPVTPLAHEAVAAPTPIEPAPVVEPTPTYSAARIESRRDPEQRNKLNGANDWSAGLSYSPKAFRLAEWRAGRPSRDVNLGRNRFIGIYIHGERVLFRKFGIASVGGELGMMGTSHAQDFENAIVALYSGGLYAAYRPRFSPRQWVVPYARIGGEALRYNYLFNSSRITGYRLLPRAEAGLEIYLNFLDASSAGEMYGNHGILRTYLYAAYSATRDTSQKDGLDLSDRALRFGVRFDF